MKLADSLPPLSSLLCWGLAAIFVVGLLRLGVKLREFQVEDAADYRNEASRQSERLVRTSGVRGRILDRNGRVLAESRRLPALSLDPAQFQRRSYVKTAQAIDDAIESLGQTIGRAQRPSTNALARHVYQLRSIPLVVWRGLNERELAVYAENECDHPGFLVENEEVRSYPNGSLAAHLLGYVGRDTGAGDAASGGERFHFYRTELRGRAGLETYYDSYLRGVPGIDALTVDANGYTIRTRVVEEPQRGLDLRLAIDIDLQREVENQLAGLRGACVALDPRTGEVLAFASAPTYDPNDFVPSLDAKLYRRLADDPALPLLNRASGGTYAPGSTFKPITALAGLTAHWDPAAHYACDGVFKFGQMRLRCSSRWGHGEIDMRHALMKSCNPYFCNLATSIGTNALVTAARAFGLGERTGLDLGIDRKGVVPDADWKERTYRERWFGGDLVQMSIGQGMLLASPLQMARVAGALGTGYLVTPRLRADAPVERKKLPFAEADLRVVREGMRMVVAGDGDSRGTGWRGGDGVPVAVSGKTGTAEVGVGERRRKNTWFIAFAPSEAPRIAIAMVVENGESGGGTTAPKVGAILKKFFEVSEASCPVFNHEPESRASRNARLASLSPPRGLKATPSARVAANLANPRLGGCARASVTKTRVPRDTKTCQPHVDARKVFGAFSNNPFPCLTFERSRIERAFSCLDERLERFSRRPKGVFVTDATTQPRRDGVDADDDDASQSRQAFGKRQRRPRQSRDVRCRRARFVVKNGWRVLLPSSARFAQEPTFLVEGIS